jgi:hypothetical protein
LTAQRLKCYKNSPFVRAVCVLSYAHQAVQSFPDAAKPQHFSS